MTRSKSVRVRRIAFATALAAGACALPGTLRADDFQIPNGYHAQQTAVYCGPAAIQMMLDTPNVLNNYVNPVLPTQNALYATAQLYNLEPWYTSPAGMTADLNLSDGNFHAYSQFVTATINQNNRTIANALNDYGVPGSVLIGQGQHWVDINGVKTTGAIGHNQAFTINAFYGRDPWPAAGTLGQNFELAYNNNPRSPWARLFTPVNPATSAIWGGAYVSVLEPQGPETIDSGAFNSTPAAPPQLANELNLAGADTDAITDVTADAVLSVQPGFENGAFATSDAVLDHYASDPSTEGDWVIPYEGSGGQNDVTGVVAIDADTGAIDYAMWEDPGQELTISGANGVDTMFADIFSGQLENDSGAQTPEPAGIGLLGAGALCLLRRRRA